LKNGQTICSYCGALADAGSSRPTVRPSGLQPPAFPSSTPPPVPTKPTVFEDIRPAKVEEIDDQIGERREAWPDAESPMGMPAPRIPSGEPQPPTTALPKPPGWVRLVTPIFYVLIFLALQYWMRNSQRENADHAPALQTSAICERVEKGQPIGPKSVFSKGEDRQVTFVSTWSGDHEGHRYEIAWHSPDSATLSASPAITPTSPSHDEFTVAATLPLGPSLATGLWRVTISQDGHDVGASSFQLVD
jgi:hypothetical protein